MRCALALILLLGCKDDPAGPSGGGAPSAPVAALPDEDAAILVGESGGPSGRFAIELVIFPDGTVSFARCNRRGKVTPERVTAVLDTLDGDGWFTAEDPVGTPEPSSACLHKFVEVTRAGATRRRYGGCTSDHGLPGGMVGDAITLAEDLVGKSPC